LLQKFVKAAPVVHKITLISSIDFSFLRGFFEIPIFGAL